ncbi:hypothetical protein [Campylobacter hyointestinalis]|uniref:hypothetical protein n=1 Tax=Campylobacter hyointestinalis TaxID=198 RepID=UPI000CE2F36F|nr:hypothetical protein [Campylobacter hyointestinalis]PPB63112.1 hypothetical protein CDQ72_01570 [Campylobacter hyointestinalis subsp. hyointestinalis]PPB65382.1 hypothetical protein CDQ73_01320 [Campylobacter hyointestinalis subsp. hyointestinalis]
MLTFTKEQKRHIKLCDNLLKTMEKIEQLNLSLEVELKGVWSETKLNDLMDLGTDLNSRYEEALKSLNDKMQKISKEITSENA